MKINKTNTCLVLATAALGSISSILLTASMTKAVTVSIFDPANSGITSLDFSVSGTTITINETWGNSQNGFLLFDNLIEGEIYTVIKNVTNQTGGNWTSLANELLDPDNGNGLGSNDDFDILPYPSFVPPGFTTSNDFDGLSFAQGGFGIPRESDIWSSVIADEASDNRDFLDFLDGNLADGATGFVTYGLRDGNTNDNEPFLLSQRPNEATNGTTTPEPSAMIGLLAVGGLGFASKLKKKSQ